MKPTNYDELAPGYDQRYRDRKYPGIERTLLAELERAAGPVVEVGCGTAQWVAALRARGVHAAGIDASRAMLSVARTRAAGHLVQANASRLPLRSGSCAGLYCVHALHHFPDKAAFIAEVARVLAPGARFVVISLDPARAEDRWVVYDYWPEARANDLSRYLSADRLSAVCGAQGLRLRVYDVAEQLDETRSAAELLARGDELKRSTSQLADLSAAEWARGLARLKRASEAALDEPLVVHAFLRLSVWVFER